MVSRSPITFTGLSTLMVPWSVVRTMVMFNAESDFSRSRSEEWLNQLR